MSVAVTVHIVVVVVVVVVHGCSCWKRNCITEKEISWFAFFGQQVRRDLNSVFFSWFYSIQCYIGPVDCYWRLV